ncbi:MAG: hypothetical protein WKF86_09345 [Acidimicrobiales bacterium]
MSRTASGRPIDGLFAAAFGLVGLALGARPIGDNSTFVHLRTGIDIVAGRGIPRVDPYSVTAAGSEWVVQSWLPSVAYGLAHRLDAGGGGLLVLNGALTALLALLVHRLARAGSPLRTLGSALVAVAVSGPWWSPRPLLFGLACLALMILVVESGRRPWLLLPVAWVWVNSHGSFPLAAVWLVVSALGAAIDEHRLVTARLRAGLWFAGGLLLACLNPLGPRLLLFPLTLGERQEVFRLITEWKAADFQTAPGFVAALGLAAACMILSRRRLPWAATLPVGAFVLLGLIAQRNLAPAGIVLAPALGMALALRPEPAKGPEHVPASPARGRGHRLLGALVAVAAALLLVNALAGGALDLQDYPVEVVRQAEQLGAFAPGQVVATQDAVGCYLILRRGRGAGVFIDDRYDMYPVSVSLDYVTLLRGQPGVPDVLDRRGVSSVLWERSRPLVPALVGRGWREAAGDGRWVLLQRPLVRDAPEGGP